MSSTSRKARKRAINYEEVESDEDIELEDQDESGEIKSMGSLGVIKRTAGDTYGTKKATSELYDPLSRVVVAVSLIDNLPPLRTFKEEITQVKEHSRRGGQRRIYVRFKVVIEDAIRYFRRGESLSLPTLFHRKANSLEYDRLALTSKESISSTSLKSTNHSVELFFRKQLVRSGLLVVKQMVTLFRMT